MSAINTNALPDDPDALRDLVRAMHEQLTEKDKQLATRAEELSEKEAALGRLDAVVAAQALELQLLRQQLAELKRQRFGRRSEKLDERIQQLELIIEDLESAEAAAGIDLSSEKPPETKAKPKRRSLPGHLPRVESTYDVDTACSDCGNALTHIGDDVSEILDYQPAQFRVVRQVRPKYSCRDCERIVQAPAPPRPIERGMASAGLLAHVAVAKFVDHLPLYRQSAIYDREGVHLERSTLADWLGQTCRLLTPLNEAVRDYVKQANKLHGDDTPVPVLQPGRKTTKQGRLWAYLRDDRSSGSTDPAAVWFVYTPDRKGKWPVEHLSDFSGTLQADGYAGFNGLYQTGRVHEAACWAHVRRKFYDIAQTDGQSMAHDVLARIAELYGIEAQVRGLSAEQRCAARQAHAGPQLRVLKTLLSNAYTQGSRKSPLSKAIYYALARWNALLRYVDDGQLEIDNNAVERQIRPVAIGRKNYLFAGADSGGERAAMLYSLVNTAKLNGLDPEAYLRHVIDRISETPINKVDTLLPWNVELPEQ